MTAPLCNDCKHYRPAFPGWCAKLSESRPEKCVIARGKPQRFRDESQVKCRPAALHFEPREQEAA